MTAIPNLTEPLALRVNAACAAAGIGRTHLYALAKQGRLKLAKIGGRTVVPMAELRRLIEAE